MKKIGYIVFIVLIWLLCLAPSVGMFLPGSGETGGGNQVLSALPALTNREGQFNADYLPQLMDYVEDHYYLRQPMVTAWASLNAKLLRSSISEDVVLGSDGWLYFGETLSDYAGLAPMGSAGIAAAAHNLHLVSSYCSTQGADFLFTIAPNKNSLYPEHMPKLTVYPSVRNAEALAEELEGWFVPYLDLFQVFSDRDETLYFAQDSHWNGRGAALAADAILNFPFGEAVYHADGPFAPSTHKGDLYDMLCPTGTALEADEVGAQTSFTYDQPIRSPENMTILTTCEGKTGSLLMFRDSFGNNLYPYLAESFGHACFSRAAAYRLDLIEEWDADLVVVELVERNIPYLVRNVPVMPAPVTPLSDHAYEHFSVAKAVLAPAGGEEIVLETSPASNLPGYVLVRGSVPTGRTPEGIYLSVDGTTYDAFLLENGGFGLYVPETALTAELSVLWNEGGEG